MALKIAALLGVCGFVYGCLGPQVSDEIPAGHLVHDPSEGWIGEPIEDDPEASEELEEYDGVGDVIPSLSGFTEGNNITYWNFGPAPDFAAPIFVLVRREGEDFVPVMLSEGRPHPNIIDVIPGDPGYSPFWAIYQVVVTDKYAGHIIASFDALEDAQRAGLVEAPVAVGQYFNCPVVHRDVRLIIPGHDPKVPEEVYYRDRVASYFDLGRVSGLDPIVDPSGGLGIATNDMFMLRREGEELLSEVVRNVDMTGDMDSFDTNDIFEYGPLSAMHAPLHRVIEVTVKTDRACPVGEPCIYRSIDTWMNQTIVDYAAATDMFTSATDGQLVPNTARVIAWHDTGARINIGILLGDY